MTKHKLLQVLSAAKPGRWTELVSRSFFRTFCYGSIQETVRAAYENANGPEAAILRHYAQVAWGIAKGNVAKARGYIRIAYESQATLADKKRALGTATIGFEDLRIFARSTDANSSRVYLAGFDESVTLFEVYRRRIVPGTAVIDVGANIGIHSLVLSRCVGQNGRVYSYEPSAAMRDRFKENMVLNGVQNVSLRGVGVGAEDSILPFSSHQGEFNIGLGRFDANGSIRTQVVKLDSDLSHIPKVSLIKIDVEGMELAVLQGAKMILALHRPAVIIEYNLDWTLEELRQSMPYAVTISTIPLTLRDRSDNLDHALHCPPTMNLLVVPLSATD